MPGNVALQSLASRLRLDLANAYDPQVAEPISSWENIVDVFLLFGQSCGSAGFTLEDSMAVASNALSEFLNRPGHDHSGGRAFDSAGIALAAVARGHAGNEDLDAPVEVRRDDFPETQHARLEALHRINRAATSHLELSEMLDTVVRVVASSTNSDASAIFLYDESTGLLSLQAAVGLRENAVGNVTVRTGMGIVGRAAIEGKLISAPDAQKHESFLAHPGIGDEKYRSQVSVPIMLPAQQKLIGILNIHSIDRRTFTQDELEFLKTAAGELAISINNAQRYYETDEQLHQKIAELGTLQRLTRSLTSTLSIESVLRMIAEQAMELVQAEAAAIFRPDPTRGGTGLEPVIESRTGTYRTLVNIEDRNSLVSDVLRNGTTRWAHVDYEDGRALLLCIPLISARTIMGALCFRLQPNATPSDDTLTMLQAFSDSAAMAIDNAELYRDAMLSIQTQQTLVQEMHHRVRNNLQTVAALLSMQLRRSEEESWELPLREAISRIQSIAAVHDLLSDEKRLAGTTVDVLARMVAEDAHSTLIPPDLHVRFDIQKTDLQVPTHRATIMSLLINELASNAIHHGFRDRNNGYIRIRAWEDSGMANVEVFNDGHRVPEGFDPAQSEGLGMKITQGLVTSDLKGTFTINSDDSGTTALISFPIEDEESVAR